MLPFGSTAITLTTGTLWLSSEWSRALMIHPALCFKVEHIIQFRWIRLGKAESIYSRLHSACFPFFPPLLIAGPFDAMSAFREPNLKLAWSLKLCFLKCTHITETPACLLETRWLMRDEAYIHRMRMNHPPTQHLIKPSFITSLWVHLCLMAPCRYRTLY